MSWLTRKRMMMVVLTGTCAWLVFVSVKATIRRGWAAGQLAQSEQAIDDQQRANERLGAQLTRMKAPAWLALLARQELNYKLPDEQVVFVYKSEKSGMIGQPQPAQAVQTDWHRWLNWVRGR